MFTAILQGMTLAAVAAGGPDGSQAEASAKRFDLLGFQVCVGDPSDGKPCHLKMYPPPASDDSQAVVSDAATEPVPIELSLFGKRVCLGAVPAEATCDMRLAADQPSGRMDA